MWQPDQQHFDVKLNIKGDSGVGKSSLLSRYVGDSVSFEEICGGDFVIKYCEVNGRECKLVIWDINVEPIRSITNHSSRGSKGGIICFDLCNRRSFDDIIIYLDDFDKYTPYEVPVLIIGCKSDKIRHRSIEQEEIDELMDILAKRDRRFFHYFESSAVANLNINEAFYFLVQKIIDRCAEETIRPPTHNPKSNICLLQ